MAAGRWSRGLSRHKCVERSWRSGMFTVMIWVSWENFSKKCGMKDSTAEPFRSQMRFWACSVHGIKTRFTMDPACRCRSGSVVRLDDEALFTWPASRKLGPSATHGDFLIWGLSPERRERLHVVFLHIHWADVWKKQPIVRITLLCKTTRPETMFWWCVWPIAPDDERFHGPLFG